MQLRPDQLQQGMRSAWMPYIEAADVDETARKAASIRGRVLFGPQDIPGTGRFAVLADPQGAVFSIYHSLSPTEGFDGDPIPGRFAWHQLNTTDHRAALDFYRRLFGWEQIDLSDMPAAGYLWYGSKGKPYGGMATRAAAALNAPPFWLCHIGVLDLKGSLAAAKRLGARVLNGPVAVPGAGLAAVLGDPQGAMFALLQRAPAGAENGGGGRSATRSRRTAGAESTKPAAKRRPAQPSRRSKAGSARKEGPGRRTAKRAARAGKTRVKKSKRA